MDTLISLGTTAAYVWSVVALLALDDAEVYFEVASVITTLILLGRWLEARARRRSGAALRALLELGAKEARVLRDGVEVAVPPEELAVGDLFVVRPGREDRDRRGRGRGPLGGRPVAAHRRARPGGRRPRATRWPARPSTPPAGSSSAPRASARTPRSPRSPGSSPRRRPGRRPIQRLADRVSGRVRPDRDRALARDARRLARPRRRRRRGVHGRRGRAHHRLPLCARARHADRAAWSARAAAPSSGSSSRAPRCSSRRGA